MSDIVIEEVKRVENHVVSVSMILYGRRIIFCKDEKGKIDFSYREHGISSTMYSRGIRQAAGILNS